MMVSEIDVVHVRARVFDCLSLSLCLTQALCRQNKHFFVKFSDRASV